MDGKRAAFRGSSEIDSGQYLGTFGRNENLAPEKALLLAVLEDAIHCLRQYRVAHDRLGKQRFREADAWINRRGSDWAFTFDNVCDLLGIEPEYLRRKILGAELAGEKPEPQSGCINGSTSSVTCRSWQGGGSFVELYDRRG